MHSRLFASAVALAALVAFASVGRADEIVVKGDRLRGTVTNVTPTTVEFETLYGDGKLLIKIEDIENLSTDGTYMFAHGDDEEVRGRIVGVGVVDKTILVGDSPDTATRIQVDQIHVVISDKAIEESPLVAAKSKLKYWSGNLNAGFAIAQGTVDSESFNAGLSAQRLKGPTRLLFDLGVLYANQEKEGEPSTTTADQLFGRTRGEYGFTERFFGYGNVYGEYNGVQRLSIRSIPEAGVGYKFWIPEDQESTDFVAGTIGGSWIYERFFGGLDEDYFAIAFGGEALVTLPYDAKFTASASYLPSVSDWTRNYLIRSQAALTFPIWKQLSFRFSIADDYDNTPAPDTTHNYLTTSLGLSVGL